MSHFLVLTPIFGSRGCPYLTRVENGGKKHQTVAIDKRDTNTFIFAPQSPDSLCVDLNVAEKKAEVMADGQQIKKTAAKVLCCVEKVSSFASSIDPIFGIVSSLVGVARKGLMEEEGHSLDKDFQAIHKKLESISQKNQECLKKIRIDEVNETYGKYEEYIKHQYNAFNSMVAQVKKDPDNSQRHMETFEKIYERDKSDMSLDVYYRGVMGINTLFGRPLLKVYLDNCDGDREIMEHRCSHIAHLFHMGLIALMGYTAVTEDDEDDVREKWAKRVKDIQEKMQEVLSQCKDKSP